MYFVFLRDITILEYDKEWGDSDIDVSTSFQEKFDKLEEVYDYIWKSFKGNKSKPTDMSRFRTNFKSNGLLKGIYPIEIIYIKNPTKTIIEKPLWEYDVYNIPI
jgi:hypothetical protein